MKKQLYIMLTLCTGLFFSLKITGQCYSFSGYFGGSFADDIRGVCNDDAGNIYYVGSTQSNNLLINPGKIRDTLAGSEDGFILKTDSCGNYIWSTYVGGNGDDVCEKILFHNQRLYVCGYTSSTNFPVTALSYMDTLRGSYDAYLLELDTSGIIQWGTYFGGTGGDFAYDLSVDNAGNVYIGGSTSSIDLPTNANSFQINKSGAIDAFIAKFSPIKQMKWCTYYGGSFGEDVHAMCNDKWDNILMTGGTLSANLSTSSGAQQSSSAGGMDTYIIKLDSTGTRIFSTYYGGSGVDDSYGIDTDTSGNIYIAGNTTSADYPVSTGSYQINNAGSTDIHIDAFSPAGLNLWSTYFGGNDIEEIRELKIINEEIILLGRTQSVNFPTMGTPIQSNLNGTNFDLAFMKFTKSGQAFYSTFYGGSNEEAGNSFTTISDYFFIGGTSYSSDYPNSPLPFQNNNNGINDGILTKLYLPISITGLNENQGISFVCYPNPTVDFLNIKSDELMKEIEIISLFGQTLYKKQESSKYYSIPVYDFNNTNLLIKIKVDEGNYTFRKITILKP